MHGWPHAQSVTRLIVAGAASLIGCEPRPGNPASASPTQNQQQQHQQLERPPARARTGDEAELERARLRMVHEQIEARGVRDARVLAAISQVPRHEFVQPEDRDLAYADHPLPIAASQTISQPYIVAVMSELADVQPGDKVLEIGTGSGYQAAVLAAMGARVYSIEIVPELATEASARLKRLGYAAHVRAGDGYAGWPEHAPFDAIVITAAPPSMPEPLPAQLALGGKLVTPLGQGMQDLWVWTRTDKGFDKRNVFGVRFVPMTGRAQGPN